MPDEIIKELWRIKDHIAREHGYDLAALTAYLQTKQRPAGQRVVDLRARRAPIVEDMPGMQRQEAEAGPGQAS